MLGYMTREKAKQLGFTHEATRCGIPVYITDSKFPRYAVKLPMLEIVIDIVEFVRLVFGIQYYSFKNLEKL